MKKFLLPLLILSHAAFAATDLGALYWQEEDKTIIATLLPEAIPQQQDTRPMIAIVIDDMGVDHKRSARAVEKLPSGVTLSYLPYAKNVQAQVSQARSEGHEIMLHMPWEANRNTADPGPHHLSVGMAPADLEKNLQSDLAGFDGYVGVNNHMGSKFSRDRAGLEPVMAELKKRGVFFLDSKTTGGSLAEKIAQEHGIEATHRDVFLDHDETPTMVGASLQEVEDVARRKGSVVAIGHPKDVTLDKLEAWLPTLEAKGFRVVPVSEVLKKRAAEAATATAKK